MPEGQRRSWWSALRWPAALAVLAWLVAANLDGVRELVASGVRWPWMATAAALRLISILLGAARWNCLLRGQGIDRPFAKVLRLFSAGYVCNFLLPGTVGGDVARAGMIAIDSPQQRMRGAATVPLDRLLGLLSFICVGAIAGLIQWTVIPAGLLRSCVILLIVVAAVGLAGLLVLLMVRFPPRSSPGSQKPVVPDEPPPLPAGESGQRQRALGHELLYGVALLRESRRSVLQAFVLAALGYSLVAMAIYCCLQAFPAADVPAGALAHLWIVPAAEVPASFLPLPGGIGAREGALALLYSALSEEPAAAERYRQAGVLAAATFSTVSVGVAVLLAVWLGLIRERKGAAPAR